jgi:hypothetical protein
MKKKVRFQGQIWDDMIMHGSAPVDSLGYDVGKTEKRIWDHVSRYCRFNCQNIAKSKESN